MASENRRQPYIREGCAGEKNQGENRKCDFENEMMSEHTASGLENAGGILGSPYFPMFDGCAFWR
ncbi:MAG: hypothetical protein JNM63_11435 [Spirochaetia bacterium]|nr:hypothetical protein [Spirochaetia bacterium]